MKKLHYTSKNECLVIDIVKNDEYGWDIDLKVFPTTALTGAYNDFDKLINDIKPFVLFNMDETERVEFAEKINGVL